MESVSSYETIIPAAQLPPALPLPLYHFLCTLYVPATYPFLHKDDLKVYVSSQAKKLSTVFELITVVTKKFYLS